MTVFNIKVQRFMCYWC